MARLLFDRRRQGLRRLRILILSITFFDVLSVISPVTEPSRSRKGTSKSQAPNLVSVAPKRAHMKK